MKIKIAFFGLASLLVIGVTHASAQAGLQDITGRPIVAMKYTEVQGSAFLTEGWLKGVVKLADGRTYKDILLRYNEVDDKLLFKNKQGDTLEFIDPVKEFKLDDPLDISQGKSFKNGFKNIPNTTENSFFEVFADGSASFVKRYSKSIVELTQYNSPTIKRFEESTKYYLIVAGKALPLKRDQKF